MARRAERQEVSGLDIVHSHSEDRAYGKADWEGEERMGIQVAGT